MKLDEITHFFVFDVESIGLHGEGFAVGYVLKDRSGITIREDWFHCDSGRAASAGGALDPQDRDWVATNIPTLSPTSRLTSPKSVRDAFWAQWMRAKADFPGVVMASECIWPVDTAFLTACVMDDVDSRKWEGPHPLLDIATVMMMAVSDVGSCGPS